MPKVRGLGRRVAKAPAPFRHSQTIPGKKTHQTKSATFRSPCHCDLFSLVETDPGALSGNSRQNQAVSGRIRQFQATSGPFQAFSGKIRQNQAESGKIGEPIGSGKSLVRDPMLFQEAQTAPPFLAKFFGVHSIKTKAQTLQSKWHHSSQDMAIVLTNPRHCHSLLTPIKMSACARKRCGHNVFLPAVSSHGHPVVAENKV